MLHDRGERHVEGLGELAHRGRPAAQPLDHGPAGGIGQGPEDLVERVVLRLEHRLHYSLTETIVK